MSFLQPAEGEFGEKMLLATDWCLMCSRIEFKKMLQKVCHVGKKLYFCTRFRKGNHLKGRIRLVVQDNCLSRSRSPVRLWYAVRKNDNMHCICRFFCPCVRLFAFFCYLCNLNIKLNVMR